MCFNLSLTCFSFFVFCIRPKIDISIFVLDNHIPDLNSYTSQTYTYSFMQFTIIHFSDHNNSCHLLWEYYIDMAEVVNLLPNLKVVNVLYKFNKFMNKRKTKSHWKKAWRNDVWMSDRSLVTFNVVSSVLKMLIKFLYTHLIH